MNQDTSSKPTMQVFVTKIEKLAEWYVDEMHSIKNSKKVVTTSRTPARVPKVPDDFHDFIYDLKDGEK